MECCLVEVLGSFFKAPVIKMSKNIYIYMLTCIEGVNSDLILSDRHTCHQSGESWPYKHQRPQEIKMDLLHNYLL